MVVKLSTKQLKEIIKISIQNTERNNSWEAIIDLENSLIETKKEVTEYLQLPDLFNCE